MVEQKFSLELTKNGVQQTIYAKEGEAQARTLKITLTVKGEVISLTGYSIKAFFDDETYLDVSNDGNPISFEIPAALCSEPGERLIELQFVHGESTVYSPKFSVIVEDSIGATASAVPIGDVVQYEPRLASADEISELGDDPTIPVYDENVGVTKRIPANYFATASDVSDLTDDVSDIDSRLTTAESDIDDAEDAITDLSGRMSAAEGDIGDIETSLASKADTSTVNAALAGKVDKVSGKGLSTNDYNATEKANVASNTSARHTHSNKTVLDKFGESGGSPTYDGNPIGGGGGTITDVQDANGNSLVADGIATIPNEVVEIYDNGTLKYTPTQIQQLRLTKELKYNSFEFVYINQHTSSPVVTYAIYYLRPDNVPNRPLLYRDIWTDAGVLTETKKVAQFSDENFTTAEKNKLTGIATGAEVNVIDTIKDSDGNPLTVTSKSVTLPAIPTFPTASATGDVIEWNGSAWDTLSKGTITSGSTGYATGGDVYTELQNIPSMPSGTNEGDFLTWDATNNQWRVQTEMDWLGYEQLEYIESTGTQYINTGFNVSNETRVVCVCDKGTGGGDNYNIFGGRVAFQNSAFCFSLLLNQDKFRSDYGSRPIIESGTAYEGTPVVVDKNNNVTTVNGVTITETAQTFSSSYPIYLFAWNNGGSVILSTSRIKIYSCQMYYSGMMRRDFVPCRRRSDGAIGMYDRVNNQFYGNAGTGTFNIPQ